MIAPHEHGSGFAKLREIAKESTRLDQLLRDPIGWNTMLVDYEPPTVYRLWRQLDDDHRIYLHRIHACEYALFHAHPWPSVVQLISGEYEMAVGHGRGNMEPPIACTTRLVGGASYEMVDPDGWHYVRPISTVSWSLMITGRPWDRTSPGKHMTHPELTETTAREILTYFREATPRHKSNDSTYFDALHAALDQTKGLLDRADALDDRRAHGAMAFRAHRRRGVLGRDLRGLLHPPDLVAKHLRERLGGQLLPHRQRGDLVVTIHGFAA